MTNNLPTGFEAYSVKDLKERLKLIPSKKRKLLCIVKEKRPDFMKSREWRQTYSFQEKSKVKGFGLKCIK